jgi:hypothetical protein
MECMDKGWCAMNVNKDEIHSLTIALAKLRRVLQEKRKDEGTVLEVNSQFTADETISFINDLTIETGVKPHAMPESLFRLYLDAQKWRELRVTSKFYIERVRETVDTALTSLREAAMMR